jgi:hypothetical protein
MPGKISVNFIQFNNLVKWRIMCTNMIVRIAAVFSGFILGLVMLFLTAGSAVLADDLALRIAINGQDVSLEEYVAIDSQGEFKADIWIDDVAGEVILHEYSITVEFMEVPFPVISRSLGNYRMLPGDNYHQELTINASEVLGLGGRPMTTGIYRSQIKLEYNINGQEKVWNRWLDIQITGNPANSVFGIAGMTISAMTLGVLIWLGTGISTLIQIARGRLESFTRGRVVGSIISVSRKFLIKEKCPVCGERFRDKKCIKCRKSVKTIRREYRKRLEKLAIQGEQLLASDEITRDELGAKLGIDDRTAADVLKVIDESRLHTIKRFMGGLVVTAIFAGLGFGISTTLWVTVGGFTALNTPALVAILVIAFILPLAVTLVFRLKANRAIRRIEMEAS